MQAGNKVTLLPGFTAAQGSYFNAKIDATLTQDATVVTYSYDALGRLISVGMPSDADYYAAYTYLADGKLYSETLVNGAETRNHFYNSPGWLLRIDGDRFTEDITHVTGWSGPGYFDGRIKTTSFTYNWTGKPDDYSVQYTYDDLGQLTSADNNLDNARDIGIGNTITYDANGNILDLTRGGSTKTYAYYTGTNKVQNLDGSGNDYVYDSNANVTSSSPKSINTIAYDTFTQRPISMSIGSGSSMALQYGGDTQRIMKSYNNGTATNLKLYLHGGNDYPLLEKNRVSVAAETLAVYIYGLNGTVAKRVGSTVLFLLKDHLGSSRVVMDATGLVRAYYDYDALGNLIRTGTVNEVKYQFTGQEYDESGLHNYRARLYDSDLGKFYATDPAEEFASAYSYAGNNPLSYTDPSGNFISLAAFAYYAYQTYHYASTVYTAYSLFQGLRHGGLSGLIQAGVSIGASSVVSGGIGSAVGGQNLKSLSFGRSILSGGLSNVGGSIASGYVSGSRPGLGSLALSGGLGSFLGGLQYKYYDYRFHKATGYHLNQRVPQEELNNFVNNTSKLAKMRKQAGNPSLSVASPSNLPAGYSLNQKTGYMEALDPITGEVTDSKILGHTRPDNTGATLPNGDISYKSQIRIAPAAFKTAAILYLVAGHEIFHGIHYYSGFWSELPPRSRRFTMEYQAYTKWDIPFLEKYSFSDPYLAEVLQKRLDYLEWLGLR